MDENLQPRSEPERATCAEEVLSQSELRARRNLILALVIVGLLLVGMIALLVILAVDAYRAAPEPSPGAVVVSLIRDAAIVLVAFESILIGALLIILTIQVRGLVVLLRDEIRPLLESVNETVATVRGTTQFMSENVVSPTIRTASFLAGMRRVAREVIDLVQLPKSDTDER